MHLSKKTAFLTILLFSIFISGCDGYQGHVYERNPDGSIGKTLSHVEIAFVSEDETATYTTTTDSSGYFQIQLKPQRYRVTASHQGHVDYDSTPGFFVVTGDGYQTGNIFLKKATDVVMISSTLLNKDTDFFQIIEQYKTTLLATAGLTAEYIELDSNETLATYGVKVNDPADWSEIHNVLEQILQVTQSSYIMILGGKQVIPRPVADVCCDGAGELSSIPSDAWYIDFDDDHIVDEGLSVSRLPGLFQNSSAVIDALQTAIELHTAGGFTLENLVKFSSNDYTTPPYGVCDTCTEMSAFFNLMSSADYIVFTGHGSSAEFSSTDNEIIFSIDHMASVDLQSHHPVIIGYFPCAAGLLYDNTSSFAYEFMKHGAAAYVARTTTEGTPTYVGSDFQPDIEAGMRIGPALFKAMRKSAQVSNDFKDNAIQISLYGDPTLKRQ
jgi:hypothetical protein